MIPLLAAIGFRRARGGGSPVWIPLPLFLAWLLLLPFVLLALPFFCAGCLRWHVNPLRALALVWQVLAGLSSTRVHVESRDHSILVHIF